MWDYLQSIVNAKGRHAVKVTKVKGHSTDAQVARGEVRREDKDANDIADRTADQGTFEHFPSSVHPAGFYARRQKTFRELVFKI